MTLAPGWRCTLRMTAGVVLAQAPSLVFCAPLTTWRRPQAHRRAVAVGDHQVEVVAAGFWIWSLALIV
jgi:hypothetical protein